MEILLHVEYYNNMLLFLLSCADDPKYFNSNPHIAITSHDEQDTVVYGDDIVFLAQASDPNNAVEDLQVQWKLDGNVLCPWDIPDENGTIRCTTLLPIGVFTIEAIVKDVYEATDSNSVQLTVAEGGHPTVQFISPSDGFTFKVDQKIPFVVQYYDQEDIPTELDVGWKSDLDGVLDVVSVGDLTTDGIFYGSTNLSLGEHSITVQVTDSDGNTTDAQRSIIVEPSNTEPNCEIISPMNHQAFGVNSNITLEGFAQDADDEHSNLRVQWISNLDGIIADLVPSSNHFTSEITGLSHNSHLITLLVEDETGALCSDSILLSISSPPTIAIQNPQDNQVYQLGEAIDFFIQATDNEDISALLNVHIYSNIDGLLWEGVPDLQGFVESAIIGLQAGIHQLNFVVTDSVGLEHSQSVEVKINTPPPIPQLSLSPEFPTSSDDIEVIATPSEYSNDFDGDPITYDVQFYRNGNPVSSPAVVSQFVMQSNLTIQGDYWEVAVTANDGYVSSETAWLIFSIQNAPPTVDAITITKNSDYNDAVLDCLMTTSDPDQTVEGTTLWYVNNVIQSNASNLVLSSSIAQPSDTITCSGYVEDDEGLWAQGESSYIVANRSPQVDAVEIIPSQPTVTDDVLCTASYSDPDEEVLFHSYEWLYNGQVISQEPIISLIEHNLQTNDSLQCKVYVADSGGATDTQTETVTIQNTPPQISSLSIENRTNQFKPIYIDTLVECVAEVWDVNDGSNVTTNFVWENVTTGQIISQSPSVQLSLNSVAGGDVISCQIEVIDSQGEANIQYIYAPVESMGPIFTQETQISINSPTTRDTLFCDFSVEDPDGYPVIVDVVWLNVTQGTQLGVNQELILHPSLVATDDTIRCMVSATDIEGQITDSVSDVIIQNTPPTIDELSFHIEPFPVYTNNDVEVTMEAFDLDLDVIDITYKWYINEQLDLEGANILPNGQLRGTDIRIEIVANDGKMNSTPFEFSFSISNTPPTPPLIEITPTERQPKENQDNLYCNIISEGSDIDNDDLEYFVSWYKNGQIWTGDVQDESGTGDSISKYDISFQDEWYCEARSFDGIDFSESSSSEVVLVEQNCYFEGCDMPVQGMDFVLIEGGIFVMGAPVGEVGRDENDEEPHLVELTHNFYMMTTEVTQAHFEDIMTYNPSTYNNCSNCPVENLSWHEAAYFANQVSSGEGLPLCYACEGGGQNVLCSKDPTYSTIYDCSGFRLPTEAEWEFAARAGQDTAFHTGNGGSNLAGSDASALSEVVLIDGTQLGDLGWYMGNSGSSNTISYRPKETTQLQANALGLYDMHGNVYEWTHDYYSQYPAEHVSSLTGDYIDDAEIPIEDTSSPNSISENGIVTLIAVNPQGPETGTSHVIRGGSFSSFPRYLRCAERRPGNNEHIGFRLIRNFE